MSLLPLSPLSPLHFHTVLAQTGISVDPLMNLTLPVTFEGNNTYSCSVTGNRQAIWEINNRQISGQASRDDFSNIGVFVTGVLGDRTAQLTFTQMGRDTYVALNQSRIAIRCTAFDNERPVTEFGEFFFIDIYGEFTHVLVCVHISSSSHSFHVHACTCMCT